MHALRLTVLPNVKPPKHFTLVIAVLAHVIVAWLLLSLSPQIRLIQRPASVIAVSLGAPDAPAAAVRAPEASSRSLLNRPSLDSPTARDQSPEGARPDAQPEIAALGGTGPVTTTIEVTTASSAPVAAPTSVQPASFDADYLDNPAPNYPPLSRRLGEQGSVLLRVLVGRDGSAEQVLLVRSSGSTRLDTAATEAVRRWRFVPARQGARTVEDWVLVPINFSLKG